MLGSYGEPDGVGLNTLVQELLLRELGVSGGSGVDHKALDVCHIGQQGEDLQMIDEIPGFFLAALDLKGEDRGASVREIPRVKRVIRVIGKRRMIDILYQRVICEVLNDLLRVLGVPVEPEREGLHTCRSKNALKGEIAAPVSRSRIARM